MDTSNVNNLGNYRDFIKAFLDRGYTPRLFTELSSPTGELLLRHDIDFDTGFALKTAQIETDLGIKSTYFFLLRSNFYNVLSPKVFDQILAIRDLGHEISIHFDPLVYENYQQGLKLEIETFQHLFGGKVNIISLHRPNDFFKNFDASINGVEHTYQSKYFRNIHYSSDSTGEWRFGHPHDSVAFSDRASMHVLIHPVWWMMNGVSNLEKLRLYYDQRVEELKNDFLINCIPFREIYETV
ncbi:MAG: hypothetical protein R2828_32110 [Saprospiraceae bacterium]